MKSFKQQYDEKCFEPSQLVGRVQSGWNCCSDIALSAPPAIMNALGERVRNDGLHDIRLHELLSMCTMPSFQEDIARQITGVSWFSGAGERKVINAGLADLMPCYYRDMPALFRNFIEIDALFLTVSPMDKHGYFTTGLTASNSASLVGEAKHIFVEVNAYMPRSLSAEIIHVSQITALCEHDAPLPVAPAAEIDEVGRTIGELIAAEVVNGATLQLGIGTIPEAVSLALKDKQNLGIHTEMFTDGMVELIECGAVTNTHKPIHRGKSVATFAYGSQRIYDYLDDNPAFEVLPVDYVNNPKTIAHHPNFVSVNGALEVDFFGQVCSESVGTHHISGTGGQVDYVRGAIESEGGKSFIAFPSTTKDGINSKICATLTPGAIVTTSKNDVDHIVTEYGIAKLRGKTLSQRTKALISIAHPKFREELTAQAKKQNIII